MAYFANINQDNIVCEVVTVNDYYITNPETGIVDEDKAISICKSMFGEDTTWIQTSLDGSIRKLYAGIGFYYDKEYDIFLPPKKFESWRVDPETLTWGAPVPKPNHDKDFEFTYHWFEDKQFWFSVYEYIYNKYAKDFKYSDIEDVVNKYNLSRINTSTIVHQTEHYTVFIERVKNYINSHTIFSKWSKEIAKSWLYDYEHKIKYDKTDNIVRFTSKYCQTKEIKIKFKKFMERYTDYYFLEEIHDILIYKRDIAV